MPFGYMQLVSIRYSSEKSWWFKLWDEIWNSLSWQGKGEPSVPDAKIPDEKVPDTKVLRASSSVVSAVPKDPAHYIIGKILTLQDIKAAGQAIVGVVGPIPALVAVHLVLNIITLYKIDSLEKGVINRIDSFEIGLNNEINTNFNEKFEKLMISMDQGESVSDNKAAFKYVEGALSSSVFPGGMGKGGFSK